MADDPIFWNGEVSLALKEPGGDEWLIRRQRMVETQIRGRGVRDERVLNAMLTIPRERFLPREMRQEAYEDRAVPIGYGQTISQPYIVAYMTEQLRVDPDSTVLEIGTGSGYQAAILAVLCKHLCSVERIPELHERAKETLAALNLTNVNLVVDDGSVGLPKHAPYDRIMVTAGAPQIPQGLISQLVDGGIMVLPVGRDQDQTIVRVVRNGNRTIETPLLPCRFVKLIGEKGWDGS